MGDKAVLRPRAARSSKGRTYFVYAAPTPSACARSCASVCACSAACCSKKASRQLSVSCLFFSVPYPPPGCNALPVSVPAFRRSGRSSSASACPAYTASRYAGSTPSSAKPGAPCSGPAGGSPPGVACAMLRRCPAKSMVPAPDGGFSDSAAQGVLSARRACPGHASPKPGHGCFSPV